MTAQRLYDSRRCRDTGRVFQSLLGITLLTKLVRFEHDPEDGEIRPNVELPVEDAELTSRQFHRLAHSLLHGVQRFDMVIRHTASTGEVAFAAARHRLDACRSLLMAA